MSQQPSILIVDDESGILDTLRILLRKEGFEVTTAQGGKAGLEQIRSGNHDIVLTDVRMPQVSGLDILQAAKEQDPMTPVILMTAQASLQTAVAAVNAGAFYYIQKPFSNDELLAILRRACEYRADPGREPPPQAGHPAPRPTDRRSRGRSASRAGSWTRSGWPRWWRRPIRRS